MSEVLDAVPCGASHWLTGAGDQMQLMDGVDYIVGSLLEGCRYAQRLRRNML
jgi:hypothetical protein